MIYKNVDLFDFILNILFTKLISQLYGLKYRVETVVVTKLM